MDESKTAYNAALGAEIRAWRGRRGLSRRQLAEQSEIAETQLERIENNKRDMNVTQLFAIARALDVDPEDIVRTAIASSGGLEALYAEADARTTGRGVTTATVSAVSGTNVTPLHRKRNDQLTAEDIDAGTDEKAAGEIDPESNEPEDS